MLTYLSSMINDIVLSGFLVVARGKLVSLTGLAGFSGDHVIDIQVSRELGAQGKLSIPPLFALFMWVPDGSVILSIFPLYVSQQTPRDSVSSTLSSCLHQVIFHRRTKVSSVTIKHFKQLCFPSDHKAGKLTSLGI